MKKLLICLLCVNFVTFISASDSGADLSVSEDVLSTDSSTLVNSVEENPEITDIEEDASEEPELVISEKSDIELQLDEVESKNIGKNNEKKIENTNSPEYPDLKEIAEPDIITLEPETNENKEELVNAELPPLGDGGKSQENDNGTNDENVTDNVTEIAGEKNAETKSKEPSLEVKTELKPEEEHKVESSQEPANESERDTVKEPEEVETVTEEVIEPVVDVIKPSRSVTLKRREYVDVTYPGTGWIYTGVIDGSKDLSYFGRALGTKDTTFTLQAIVPGTKLLHFCKNDYLTGEYIDDYIEIVILPDEGSNKTRIKAPEYKQPEPEVFETFEKKSAETETVLAEKADDDKTENEKIIAEIAKKENNTENTEKNAVPKTENKVIVKETEQLENHYNESQKKDIYTEKEAPKVSYHKSEPVKNIPEVVNTDNYDITLDFEEDGISIPEEEVIETSENSDVTDCDTLLKEANFLYNEKEFEAAINKVNTYLEYAPTNLDKGLLLKGKILEAKSDIQDIRGAIQVYNTLMKEYPASIHWDEANKRVIYLKRFYLEVR